MTTELDPTVKQKVSYCIPLEIRDVQIQLATERIKARIAPTHEMRADPVAIVCFGPSLKDTWEEIRKFKYVISCSGSHKFLVERGIIPTWHVEVDPRPHKVQLIGPPHKDVEYLIASTCHPAVFDHLEGMNVKLWHVFATDEESLRVLPPGEWALTGGSGVGLRCMNIARFFGFREQHIFGMDGSEKDGEKHASLHPMQPKDKIPTPYGGRTFLSTPSMVECARQTFHELNQMSDVNATFYGDGLVQAMAKDYVRVPSPQNEALLGIVKPDLISPEYRALNKKLHEGNPVYGIGGGLLAPVVIEMVKKAGSKSVLDYGCGKGFLAKALPFPIWEYDPCIPGKDAPPRPADLVCCFDVLEHIEPDKLDVVLNDLRRCVKSVGYFTIAMGPAKKTLPDGRNTHLIQKPMEWWREQLSRFFNVAQMLPEPKNPKGGLYVIVSAKSDPVSKLKGTQKAWVGTGTVRRWHVLEQWIKERGWKTGVEVGVKDGRTYLYLLQKCPSLKLTGVDIFEPRPGIEVEGGESHAESQLPEHEARLRKITKDCFSTRGRLIKGLSLDAVADFEDGSLDFVFIDADHREAAVRADIAAWRPKIRPGGVLCGHDANDKWPGVLAALNDLCPGWKPFADSVWEYQC